MSNILLTKDTDKVLCSLYKEYLLNIKNNIPKSEALNFTSEHIDDIFENKDIDFELSELKNNSLIETDIIGNALLTSKALIYMENRFKNGIVEVTDFIAKFL